MNSLLGRLCWDGRKGIAVSNGVQIELRQCPLAPPIAECDYAPPVNVFQVREGTERPRDMTTAERETCAAILQRVAGARALLITS